MTDVLSRQQTEAPFADIPSAPPDPILGLTEAFNNDQNPGKVNLGVGVYQNAAGKVPLLKAVREAEKQWLEKEDTKTYLPIDGIPAYDRSVQSLLLGADSKLIAEGRAITAQALGGTGALKIGADFLRRFLPEPTVWLSSPSWENHSAIFESAGFAVQRYPYYKEETHSLDFAGMMQTLETLPANSLVVLHACCHNPTGVDLSEGQWKEVAALVRSKRLMPFLDFAYQGFGDGIDKDAFAVRAFAHAEIPCFIANSFSKSFSLYRERVGALTILTGSAEESKRLLSQLKRVIRTNYSSPPSHGGQIVAMILADSDLRSLWEAELTEMRERIHTIRHRFLDTLRSLEVKQDFRFIVEQKGMFSYSGLPIEAVRRLRSEFGIYIVDSGRICVAALNDRNLDYVCEAISRVL